MTPSPGNRRALVFLLALAAIVLQPERTGAQERAIGAAEREAIEKAAPAKAIVTPRRPRRLLVFDLNVGYPGHASIAHANHAFKILGERTGAFEAEIRRDPEVFERESLRRFDAVLLNNTVGNLFEDPALRRSLAEFVRAGGGLMGIHGTTVAFTRWPGAHEDWPEFGFLIGARGARHRAGDERVVIRIDSPGHPLVVPFDPAGFEYRDEFYRVGDPYSRERVRVLLAIDSEKTKLEPLPGGGFERADGDYALAWVRRCGRGRVFYSTIGHAPGVFSDPLLLDFYLRAAQFVLGDLDAPATPSARLTPAVLAQEKLGWRLGVEAYSFHKYTFFEAIEKTAALGLSYIGGLSFQKVSRDIPKNFGPALDDGEIERVRLALDAAGVRLLNCYVHDLSGDEEHCRRVFEFGRKLGIETFIGEPPLEALDVIERFCDEYDIRLAIHNHDRKASPAYWHPEELMRLLDGRSRRIGACPDIGYWLRSGIDPVEGVRRLGDRLVTIQLHDLHAPGAEGHDVPWGTGTGGTRRLLEEIHRLGITPAMFGLEYSYDWFDSMPEMKQCAEFFDRIGLELAAAPERNASDDDALHSALWGRAGELWSPGGRLPDFSFAGYRRGEAPLPSREPEVSVRDFGAAGDGRTDDTAAFRRAIERSPGKVIGVPPGRYLIADVLEIAAGSTVLKGAGRLESVLVFTKPLNEIRPNWGATTTGKKTSNYSWSGGFIQATGRFAGEALAELRAPARRGETVLEVADAGRIRAGDELRLLLRDTDENSLARHLYAGDPGPIDNLRGRTRESLVFRVLEVDAAGKRLRIDRSLRADARLEWRPRLYAAASSVEEVGVEDLGFEFPETPYQGHFTELGFNALAMSGVRNSWARRLRILNADSGIFLRSENVTLENILIESSRPVERSRKATGHHGVTLGGQDNLLTNFEFRTRFLHDITVTGGSAGNVASKGSAPDLAFDHHRYAPHSNLFTDIDIGEGSRMFQSGGGAALGRHSGAWQTFWSIRSRRPQSWPEGWAPDLITLVGLRSDQPAVTSADGRWFEPLDPDRLLPRDLHAAQLDRRLRRDESR